MAGSQYFFLKQNPDASHYADITFPPSYSGDKIYYNYKALSRLE
jgi:hypothetical protein